MEHPLETALDGPPAPRASQNFDEFVLERRRVSREDGKEVEALRKGALPVRTWMTRSPAARSA